MNRILAVAIVVVGGTVTSRGRPIQAGVLYSDPAGGWRYTYDGTFNASIGGLPPGYGNGSSDEDEALDGAWRHDQADKWDGSGPGEIGPIPDGDSPGGAEALVEGNTNYLRIQDTGNPELHGWVQGPEDPINSNRRVFFGHLLKSDGDLPGGNELVLDAGITISFRARIPNSGPLDDIYSTDDQGAPAVSPWFDDQEDTVGRGYPVHDEGRGLFGVVQNDAGVFGFDQDSAIAFSLMTSDDVEDVCEFGANSNLCASPEQRGGLIMNNRVGSTPTADIDTFDEGTLNLLEIDDEDLDDWREFWITIESENGPGTHEVNVYLDGGETATTFHVTATDDGNAEYLDDAWLFMGMSSSSLFGSVDVDFFSYTLGVVAPQTAQVLGDMDCDGDVDFDDIGAMVLALRRPDEYESTYGVPPELKGDIDGDGDLDFDDVDPGFIDILRGGVRAVPEPSTGLLAGCLLSALGFGYRFRSATVSPSRQGRRVSAAAR